MHTNTKIAAVLVASMSITMVGCESKEEKVDRIKNETIVSMSQVIKNCYQTVHTKDNNIYFTEKYRRGNYKTVDQLYQFIVKVDNLLNSGDKTKLRKVVVSDTLNETLDFCDNGRKNLAKALNTGIQRIAMTMKTSPNNISEKLTEDLFILSLAWFASTADYSRDLQPVINNIYARVKSAAVVKIERCLRTHPLVRRVHPYILLRRPDLIGYALTKCSTNIYDGILTTNEIAAIGRSFVNDVHKLATNRY